MRIHILGICGTFMGGLALIARQLGHEVSGSDANVYPPMSNQLTDEGIQLFDGYDPAHLKARTDLVIIGNALSRGNQVVEHVLDQGLSYTSGPGFLADHVLQGRWVLAVAGTHGKTTTSCMLAWILEYAGLKPGFLIGGVPHNFTASARLGSVPFFVVEADEYDSAFFDKRSKFIHYRPRTLIMNNLEYDHADIFPDLEAIKRQFHHLVRTVPGNGLIVMPADDQALHDVIKQGCWTPLKYFTDVAAYVTDERWNCRNISPQSDGFDVYHGEHRMGRVEWPFIGQHNIRNALAAIAAAQHAGVLPQHAIRALSEFRGVKRRMEKRATIDGITIYDDFAHHPTAISATLDGLRRKVGKARIIAVVEPRSNTMRMGVYKDALAPSLLEADQAVLYQPPEIKWRMKDAIAPIGPKGHVFDTIDEIVLYLRMHAQSGDHIVIMSNGVFGGLQTKLIEAMQKQ